MGVFYLHIGMHKTASSSCQQLFSQNTALLAAQGLRYFNSFDANHSFFLINFFETERRDMRRLLDARYVDARYGTHRETLWRRWLDFLEQTGTAGDDALLSGESGGFLTEESIVRLRDQVLEHFDRMKVLMLVRPPLSFARSAAQQRLKGGHSLEALAAGLPTPKYRRRLEGYRKALGAQNISLELFHPERMVDGDPARTLLAMMNKTEPALAPLRAPRINEAISRTGAKLLSALQSIRRNADAESRIPPLVRDALRALPPQRFDYAGIVGGAYADRLLSTVWSDLARTLPGERFDLPVDVQRTMPDSVRRDVRWASALLGADIGAYDISLDPNAPTLAELIHIDAHEAEIIAGHLAALGVPAEH